MASRCVSTVTCCAVQAMAAGAHSLQAQILDCHLTPLEELLAKHVLVASDRPCSPGHVSEYLWVCGRSHLRRQLHCCQHSGAKKRDDLRTAHAVSS